MLFFFFAVHRFDVDGVLHSFALVDRWLGEILAAAKFFEYTGALVFAFEFLESAFDVVALFDRHNYHCCSVFS